MAILLVRHGETSANATRVVQHPDAPLSERGLAQAERLAARLAGLGVAAIVSSDHARARVTAECVRAATSAPLELWPELCERNFGELRGRSYAEIGIDIFAPDFAPPGGETWPEFHARVERVFRAVGARAAELDGNLAVISHGLVCRSVVERLTRPDQSRVLPEAWLNTSLTVLSKQRPHEIELLNCSAHLDGLEAPIAAISAPV
jgi:broad specificity phosphatase PhoE